MRYALLVALAACDRTESLMYQVDCGYSGTPVAWDDASLGESPEGLVAPHEGEAAADDVDVSFAAGRAREVELREASGPDAELCGSSLEIPVDAVVSTRDGAFLFALEGSWSLPWDGEALGEAAFGVGAGPLPNGGSFDPSGIVGPDEWLVGYLVSAGRDEAGSPAVEISAEIRGEDEDASWDRGEVVFTR